MKSREEIVERLVKGKNVLDLGNAWGDFSEFIKEHAKSYTSVDIEPGADYKHDLNKPLDLKKKFDVIIAGELIEHVLNTGVFLDTIKKQLKPKGTFFLSTPNPTSFRFIMNTLANKEPSFAGHVQYFTKDALTLALRTRFSHVEVGFTNNTTNIARKNWLWNFKYDTECVIGDIIPRWSPHLYAVCQP
jgi:2-polyprenyl-3-methyl-5-hydroxy-6-metoxy-1,4-benzoquinol methylase